MDNKEHAPAATAPPRHMPALDGLRGLAISLVLCCHANVFIGAPAPGSSTFDHLRYLILGGGWIGVNLFFVLSGFLITGILVATKSSSHYFKSFYARRFLRIFPLYYLYVIAIIGFTRAAYTNLDRASLLFFFYNFRAISLQHHLLWVNSLWSLAVEEQFYLVWPILIVLLRRRTLQYLCVAGVVFALALRIWSFPHDATFQSTYYSTLCRMDDLLIGALLALWRSDEGIEMKMRRYEAPVGIAALIGLFAIAAWTGHFMDFVTFNNKGAFRHSSVLILGPGMTLLAALSAVMVAKCWHQNPINSIFLFWPLRRLGKYSYGMYMLHWPLLYLIQRAQERMQSHFHVHVHSYFILPAIFVTCYAGAVASFYVFERHFLRLKRLFPAL
ncbi:Peptidoglycan/LPS O-acetylase OafA/YrhL, contains acyltransferase and SGNH-hydrolase domains [Granulicella pectinivorans]|uniref:Peptidoglycan/LPS O-acetylase OafA/YrhL, contains acyltransferase and SGNH-hydrolase domains n=1 Tax=Granulicella pectinivorans TaxID=474950 RepID=A0A1I6MY88_9BACT|nr:acyltransferase [Granulicella pectinivorans]SFS20670.1 Peptidoglycan/LPS O-acetylase OafA/YrhL, contains acyltransferase and SGNH-hydrolase domains [Granulicella pectinivorans]